MSALSNEPTIFISFYSSVQTSTGLLAYFFLNILLRNKNTVYTIQSPKKMHQAVTAFANDCPAKPSKNNNGAIMTIAGKLERMYKLDVGVLSPGSTSFIRIIPFDAVPVRVPKLIKKNSCSNPLKHSLETRRIYM